jgi:uncharacterized phage protein gp47/JayE
MGTWTSQGFTAKSVEYYKTQLEQAFTTAFGNDFLLDPTTPQGVLIQELAELFYNADMDGIEVMSRMNLNTISGLFLDFVGSMRGVARLIGTPATLTVTISSNPNTLPFTIPQGQTFALNGGSEIFTVNAATTISSATQSIVLYGTQRGETSAHVDDLLATNISNITNIVVTGVSQGVDEESDVDYRNRLRQRYTAAQGTVEFVVNKLWELPCVKTVGVNYNDTDSTVDTIPAHATEYMAISVDGYDATSFKTQVAECILNNKTPGSTTFGNTEEEVHDVFGVQKVVKFTIPEKKVMSIQVSVATPESGVLNLTNVPDIKKAIANYINTLGIGKDVSYSRCMAPLTADNGFEVSSFKKKAAGDANWTTNANYTITNRAYASITEANIEIGA